MKEKEEMVKKKKKEPSKKKKKKKNLIWVCVFLYLGDRAVGILHVIVRRQINIILSRESKCCFRNQKEEINHLATDKNQPLISVVDLSRAIKKTERCKYRGFSPGSPVFSQPQKQHPNFQLSGPEPDRRRTTSWIWHP